MYQQLPYHRFYLLGSNYKRKSNSWQAHMGANEANRNPHAPWSWDLMTKSSSCSRSSCGVSICSTRGGPASQPSGDPPPPSISSNTARCRPKRPEAVWQVAFPKGNAGSGPLWEACCCNDKMWAIRELRSSSICCSCTSLSPSPWLCSSCCRPGTQRLGGGSVCDEDREKPLFPRRTDPTATMQTKDKNFKNIMSKIKTRYKQTNASANAAEHKQTMHLPYLSHLPSRIKRTFG